MREEASTCPCNLAASLQVHCCPHFALPPRTRSAASSDRPVLLPGPRCAAGVMHGVPPTTLGTPSSAGRVSLGTRHSWQRWVGAEPLQHALHMCHMWGQPAGRSAGSVAINWARVHCSIVLPHFPQLLSNTLILIHNGWFNAAVFPSAGLWLTRTSKHCPAQHENTTFCSAPAHLCSLLTGWWLRWRGMPRRDSRWTSGASAAAWHWTLLAAPPSGEPHSCVAVCWCVLGWGGVDWGGEGHPWAGSL